MAGAMPEERRGVAPGEAWVERKEEADVQLKLNEESSG
jgi:hypothetical protein